MNGIDVAFTNADPGPASYLGLFPNITGKVRYPSIPKVYFPYLQRVVSSLLNVPRPLAAEYFMFLESGFGGNGYLMQSDGSSYSYSIAAAAIGIR